MYTILVVDDEPQNQQIIEMCLEEEPDYTLIFASDGSHALDILEERWQSINLVLLDRMMPNMDGMEVMQHLMKTRNMNHIPVIMQTAMSDKADIRDGIEAGVYYYLTKPFEEDMLRAIIRAALKDNSDKLKLLENVHRYKLMADMVENCHFSFRTLDESRDVTQLLCSFFPFPEFVATGISEVLINAVEHGNLAIDYYTKGKLVASRQWEDEIKRRLELPEYRDRKVRVSYTKFPDRAELVVTDEGEGFEWENYMDIDPARATDPNGRGIAMANLLSFDSMEYRGQGNEVCCTVKF